MSVTPSHKIFTLSQKVLNKAKDVFTLKRFGVGELCYDKHGSIRPEWYHGHRAIHSVLFSMYWSPTTIPPNSEG